MFFSLSCVDNLLAQYLSGENRRKPLSTLVKLQLSMHQKTARKSRTWSATCPVFSQISVELPPRLNETTSGFDTFLRDLHSMKIASITLKGILFTWNYLAIGVTTQIS